MPVLHFTHENKKVLPYDVPCEEHERAAVIAANTGNGWSLVTSDDEPAAPVVPPADPPQPDNPHDLHDEEH